MPRFDRTGPGGMGPMTGRGLGPCGRGYGWGRGSGYGGGWDCGPWGCPPLGYAQRVTKKEEKEILEDELGAIQEEMNEIKARLEELRK